MAITASVLPPLLNRLTTVWPGNMQEKDFVPKINFLLGIKDQQTARLDYVTLPDQRDAKVTWMGNCDIAVASLDATECTFSGVEADTVSATYSIDQAVQSTYSTKLDEWRDNEFTFADAAATNLLQTEVKHAEYIAKYGVAVVNASLGESTYDNNGAWTVSGTSNLVPAAEWDTTAIFGHLKIAAEIHRMSDPYILSGQNLYQLLYMSNTSAANADGKGDARRVQDITVYNDVTNVEAVNSTKMSYLIERGALAFLSKGYYPRVPEVLDGNFTRFSVPNRFYPDLIHDVEMVASCASGVWKMNWKVISRYKILVNPTGCTSTRTGILGFTYSGI